MYQKALSILQDKNNFYIDLGLNRIKTVLNSFDNPQEKLNCIHVAGTNGKGSVCAILHSILTTAGYKTGLYTSPHIFEYTERIKINNTNISEKEFSELIFEVQKKVQELNTHLTEFEILTVIMFLHFYRNNVEIVILETGLGGRLDATNVLTKNLCSIITQIDLDHTDRLGNTKDKIAYEKAGIIKGNSPIFTSMGFEAIKDKADELNSLLVFTTPFVNPLFIEACTLKGQHQVENLALAINTINYLFKDITEETIIKGLKNIKHPCRFQYIQELNLIVDASHNPNGITALKTNLNFYFPNTKKRFIFGALKNKDYSQMMNILFEKDDEIFLNEFNYPNACSYEDLKKACHFKTQKYKTEKIISNDKLNIICGSFYMIGQMNWLKEYIIK